MNNIPALSKYKVCVKQKLLFTYTDVDSNIFVWEDGIEFIINKVMDVIRVASLKADGSGMRYTCSIFQSKHAYSSKKIVGCIDKKRQLANSKIRKCKLYYEIVRRQIIKKTGEEE